MPNASSVAIDDLPFTQNKPIYQKRLRQVQPDHVPIRGRRVENGNKHIFGRKLASARRSVS